MYEWDETKRQQNRAKHGVDFSLAEQFVWQSAITVQDIRRDYGEMRLFSTGLIGSRLYILVWTRRDSGPRIISLRRANEREQKRWENERR